MRILQVQEYNQLVISKGIDKRYLMTSGDGSMYDKPRVRGWVVFQFPTLGDEGLEFARWFSNRRDAMMYYAQRQQSLRERMK